MQQQGIQYEEHDIRGLVARVHIGVERHEEQGGLRPGLLGAQEVLQLCLGIADGMHGFGHPKDYSKVQAVAAMAASKYCGNRVDMTWLLDAAAHFPYSSVEEYNTAYHISAHVLEHLVKYRPRFFWGDPCIDILWEGKYRSVYRLRDEKWYDYVRGEWRDALPRQGNKSSVLVSVRASVESLTGASGK